MTALKRPKFTKNISDFVGKENEELANTTDDSPAQTFVNGKNPLFKI